MASEMHQFLRNICCDSGWTYAVFWELDHRSPMILTWKNVYYDTCEQRDFPENGFSRQPSEKQFDWNSAQDHLGLALEKMSCQNYSLGEGIIGQVAVSGKYRWVISQMHTPTSSEDGWEAQFAAGIKTVAVIPVVPRGVVQLGSLNTIIEDVNMVCHIRDFFSNLREFAPSPRLSGTNSSSCLADVATSNMIPAVIPDCSNKAIIKEHKNIVQSELNVPKRHLKPQGLEILYDIQQSVNKSFHKPTSFSDYSLDLLSHNSATDITNIYSSLLPIEKLGVDVCDGVKLSDYDEVHQNEFTHMIEHPKTRFQNVKERLEFQNKSCGMDQYDSSLKFPAGFELHEVLGPAFLKELNCFDWRVENTEDKLAYEMPERMNSSQLTSGSHLEHLLESIVSNANHGGSDLKNEESNCKSAQSLLTTEKYTIFSSHGSQTVLSAGYSIDQPSSSFIGEDSQHCLSSSGVCGMPSPERVSSKCPSKGSDHFEPAKSNKKRAKPGENCRPRPRDRQLIQDRIKELRELVPNGAKCSIDSLLERTIKHMIFLQGITRHADKLKKCAKVKLHQMGNSMIEPSSNEEGSSWAVEVGGHLKVCSIIVENLNKNGQILVQMVCEECSHFLEIAGAIKSLGLSILKGTTEAHGEKIWICFVVEGENNRSIHSMDILWSLVRILQPRNVI